MPETHATGTPGTPRRTRRWLRWQEALASRRGWRIAPHLFLSVSALLALGAGLPRAGALVRHEQPAAPADPSTDASAPAVSPAPAVVLPARTIERTFWSAALGREMPVTVFLPPGYDAALDARYPVLYMLHGLGGDHRQWAQDGLLTAAADRMVRGELAPFLIVLPEGERGYWMDHAGGGPRFGAYIGDDLVAMVDRDYRTLARRESRAIGGMSMGGHGALQLALNRADTFGVVGAHSVALRRKDQAFAFFGDDRAFAARDPLSLLQSRPEVARRLAISIDIGAADEWASAATAFHRRMEAAGIAHRWALRPGAHDDAYWAAHVAEYLDFYGSALSGRQGQAG